MGAAKGTAKPDVTGFRKKGTGQPTLAPKAEGNCNETLRYVCPCQQLERLRLEKDVVSSDTRMLR